MPIQRRIPSHYLTGDSDTTHVVMIDEFCVRFKLDVPRDDIEALNEKHGVEVFLKDEQDQRQAREYNEYLLRVTEDSKLNALEAANLYYESTLTAWSVPNFFVNYQSTSDPLYDDQYHLNNTSSNPGETDVDIDAPEAWDMTKGSSSITVAVVDDGVEQHEDFYSGQFVTGTTAGGGDGSPDEPEDQHGQAVAGIIAANHNSIGVRGVAPNVRIMSVKIIDVELADNDDAADAVD